MELEHINGYKAINTFNDDQSNTIPPIVGTDFDENEPVLGRVICEGETPNNMDVWFRITPGKHTSAGKIVGVRGRNAGGEHILTLIRVESVHENNPHEDGLSSNIAAVIPFETRYAKEGRSTIIYRIAKATTLEEIVYTPDKNFDRVDSVETLPLSGSPVVEVEPDVVIAALNLSPTPDGGLDIGTAHGSKNIPIIPKRDIVQTHVFIAGGIGRGKSYARGVIAEECWAHGIPQINIDPMGEMIQATEDLGGMNVVPGEDFTLPLSSLQPDEVIDAIPAINRGTNIETLVRYAHEKLLDLIALKKGSEFGVEELIETIKELAPELDMKAATYGPAMQRAKSLSKIPYIGEAFDWEGIIKPGMIINIDCRRFSVTDLRLITAAVARDIQRLARAKKIPFTILSMDEAHLIAPNDDKIVTTQVLREIARIGRHYRLGLIMTTQSPADMDRSILKRLLTRLIFALEPDQLESIRGVFSDAPPTIIKQLPKLPKGTCLLTGVSETIKHATLVKIRERKTRVQGGTPQIFDDYANSGWTGRRSFDGINPNTKE